MEKDMEISKTWDYLRLKRFINAQPNTILMCYCLTQPEVTPNPQDAIKTILIRSDIRHLAVSRMKHRSKKKLKYLFKDFEFAD